MFEDMERKLNASITSIERDLGILMVMDEEDACKQSYLRGMKSGYEHALMMLDEEKRDSATK